MADKTVSAEDAAGPLDGSEKIRVVQAGVSKRSTIGLAVALALASVSLAGLSGAYADLTGKPTLGTASALASDTDGTLAANSDIRVPSQKAVKTYVDAAVTGLLDFKGSTDASGNPNYAAAAKGDAYIISVAGKIGGASGKSVDIGDAVVASADNAGGTEASVGTSWFVLEHNLVGAVISGGALGTPSSGNLSNCTSLPISTGISGLAANVATFLGTPSSANLAAALTDKTGSGLNVFQTSPTLVTPTLGVAVATSINKVAITAPATSATLTIADGKTFTASNTLTLTGTDGSTLNIGAGGTFQAVNAMTDTWNSGGTTFDAFKMTVTDTASAAASRVINIMGGAAGTTLIFQVRKDGAFNTPSPFTLQIPDNGTAGGNARGANAVDLQYVRSANTQVASGTHSFTAGKNCTASADQTVAIGSGAIASAANAMALNGGNASGASSVAVGTIATASASSAVSFNSTGNAPYCFVSGQYADARSVYGARAHAAVYFTGGGDQQTADYVLSRITTDATAAVVLTADHGTPTAANQPTLPNNGAYTFRILVVARRTDSADYGAWEIVGAIRRDTNAAGTAIIGSPSVTTIAAPSGAWTAPAVAADTTNGCLQVNVAGAVGHTVRWVAKVNTVEVKN